MSRVSKSKGSSDVISSSKGTPRRGSCRIVDVGELSRDGQSDYERLRRFFTTAMLEEHVLPIINYKSTLYAASDPRASPAPSALSTPSTSPDSAKRGAAARPPLLSLRLLDWLVTNYAKAYPCEYKLANRLFPFNIHQSYRAKLAELGKSGFDPFCRDNRIYFQIDERRRLLTTIGQLNFFRWAIECQVLAFARTHLQAIEEHMNSAEVRQAPKRTKSDGQPAKRRELSRALAPVAATYAGTFGLDL